MRPLEDGLASRGPSTTSANQSPIARGGFLKPNSKHSARIMSGRVKADDNQDMKGQDGRAVTYYQTWGQQYPTHMYHGATPTGYYYPTNNPQTVAVDNARTLVHTEDDIVVPNKQELKKPTLEGDDNLRPVLGYVELALGLTENKGCLLYTSPSPRD